jgi:hypothetical protein
LVPESRWDSTHRNPRLAGNIGSLKNFKLRREITRNQTLLGTSRGCSYSRQVTGFLRFAGILNAAIWLGAAIFFTCGIGPAVFSQDMRDVLHLAREPDFRFYAGGVALVFIKRYFILQYVCGAVALLHLGAERFYLGRKAGRAVAAFLIVIFALGLAGGFWLQPKMQVLRQAKYSAPTPEQKEQAGRSFDIWHGVSQAGNLGIMLGLVFYLVHVTRPAEAGRYNSMSKFRS